MHHLSLWRSHSHHQNRHYHSGSPCCESPWTIHLHGRLQPIFYLTKWGYLLFTHTNTKTAKHKHPSARALVINLFFLVKLGLSVTLTVLSLLWQTQKIQTLASICIANFAGAPASNFFIWKLRGLSHTKTHSHKHKQSILMHRRELSPSGYALQVICF